MIDVDISMFLVLTAVAEVGDCFASDTTTHEVRDSCQQKRWHKTVNTCTHTHKLGEQNTTKPTTASHNYRES